MIRLILPIIHGEYTSDRIAHVINLLSAKGIFIIIPASNFYGPGRYCPRGWNEMLSFGSGGLSIPRIFLWSRGGSFSCCGARCSSSRGKLVGIKI